MAFSFDPKTGAFVDVPNDPEQRRIALAQMLYGKRESRAPSQSWGEGLANLGTDLVQAHTMAKMLRQGEQRSEDRDNLISGAVEAGMAKPAETKTYGDGTQINWDARGARPDMTQNMLLADALTRRDGVQMQQHQQASQAAAAAERANLDYQAKLARENKAHEPIKMEDGTYAIPAMIPGYGGAGQAQTPAPQHPAAVSASAANPAVRTTGQPPAAPGTAPTPPSVQSEALPPMTKAEGQPPTGQQPPADGRTTGGGGVRGNNFGNIRTSDSNAWQGKTTEKGSAFETFDTPQNGLRAVGVTLQSYAKQGVNTLEGIIRRWAPPNENNTTALIQNAMERTGLLPNEKLDLTDPDTLAKVMTAIVIQEHGQKAVDDNLIISGANAALGRTQVASASDGSVRSDATAAVDAVVPPSPTTTPPQPAAPGSVRADLEAAGADTLRWENGRLVGGKSAPKVRPLAADELEQLGLPKGTVAQVDRDGRVTVVQAAPKQGEGGPSKNERDWRQEFKEPLKQATELTSQVGIIRNAAKVGNGTADTALITAFNKLLDPGAVVREADVALTRAAQSTMEQLNTWYANKAEGDILPEQLRQRISELTEQIYQTSNSVLRDRVLTYREAAESEGANWDRIVPPKLRTSLGWDDKPVAPPAQPGAKPGESARKPNTTVNPAFNGATDDQLLKELGFM
jgi:hypothetical protein